MAVACSILVSCLRDSGYISPDDERNLRSLGTFVGRVKVTGDSAALGRLPDFVRPKVAVLWRSIGFQDNLSTDNVGVEATPPYQFSIDLLQPPPKEAISATEVAFGFFTVFSDVDGNGVFNRLLDPDLKARYAMLDSLGRVLEEAKAGLRSVSDIRSRTPVSEIFFIDAPGILVRGDRPSPDTLAYPGRIKTWEQGVHFLTMRQRILANQNRWERFFSVRKKKNEYYRRDFVAVGHGFGVEIRYDRRIFPKAGREKEFDLWADKAASARLILSNASEEVLGVAFMEGKLDYPFSGYPDRDWIAGRTIEDLLLFLPDQATLDTLLDAFATSTFRVSHSDRLNVGYNVVRCDDQYVCEVRAQGDSILVHFGTTEGFFNAPATQVVNPFGTRGAIPPLPPPASSFESLQGRYALNGSDTASLIVHRGELWCDANFVGLVRVAPMDSLGFRSPVFDFQGLITHGVAPRLSDRLIQYFPKSDWRTSSTYVDGKIAQSLIARIDLASGFERADVPESALARCAGDFDYNGDTLRVSLAGGDSLLVRVPGFSTMFFHAVDDSSYRCPWGELSLEFRGFDGTAYRRALFGNGASKKTVPVFRPAPSNAVVSIRKEEPGIAWVSADSGSGRDGFTALDGRKRYACSRDGRFLRPGDGYLAEFSRTGPDDSISFRQGGDFATFRIPGMQGKTVLLELRQCAERAAKTKRIRVSVWGGSNRDSLRELYGDHQWMATDTAGVHWTFDSIAVDVDPFYLVLRQENTPDAPFLNAFDAYRVGSRP